MRPATLALVLGAVAGSALGQLLLKAGARALDGLGPLAFLPAAARDPRVLAGTAAWGVSTVCWLYVLRVAPLSRAYLLSSLTYVLVPLAGVLAFGERLRGAHLAGMALILAGVACLLAAD
ncbi:EamA family transporter [Roseisolibacter sp. H3M3-2]|uniref:EamA family transporter n=1 Tax=Roseisolibacter sp. H3M3-2 TaxID=3031323 RepID=UPI0023DA94F7|nr:EamA family transporter [Roseisolibacter sp. H3M3-2]MDF1501418.1 EamA family transporter [Roseisolibacter sp. H3M3-2]